jgi:hypothetical protein
MVFENTLLLLPATPHYTAAQPTLHDHCQPTTHPAAAGASASAAAALRLPVATTTTTAL